MPTNSIIIDNVEYTITHQRDGTLLLKPKITKINDIDKLKQYEFCNSNIVSNLFKPKNNLRFK